MLKRKMLARECVYRFKSIRFKAAKRSDGSKVFRDIKHNPMNLLSAEKEQKKFTFALTFTC
ncbi:MAG: hypothetical protein IKJ26_06415 [Clostridia bacterium]|nr:hypothetical protein [Clostridia bacterium]